MKLQKIFLLFIVCLLVASCKTDNRQVTADFLNFPPAEGSESGQAVPVITFDSTVYHFGTIAIGEKVQHSFRFENTGEEALLIKQVTPSCGCTVLKDWPQEPVLPGESGMITVEFNSKGFPGAIDKSISVLTNCIPREYTLKMIGAVSGIEAPEKPKEGGMQMERAK